METSKEVIEKATKEGKYKPQLSLFTKLEGGGTISTGPHTVKLISDRAVMGTDYQTNKKDQKLS